LKVLDTSVLYPHPLGHPYKRSLKELASKFLQRFIQNHKSGHDSFEDAVAAMDLAKLKVAKGRSFGHYE